MPVTNTISGIMPLGCSNRFFGEIHFFTARIRRMGRGNIFSLSVSSHLGGYPIQLMGGGTPFPGLDSWQGGTPFPGLDGGVPHPADRGEPLPSSGWGVPPRQGVPLPPDQHSMYLLRGGRYASCVHSGGLSCISWRWSIKYFFFWLYIFN